jgi:hypothetical protein
VLRSFNRYICVILRMPSFDSVPSLPRTHLLRCSSYSQRDSRNQVPGGQRHLPAVLPGELHDAHLLEHLRGAVRAPVGAAVHVSVPACLIQGVTLRFTSMVRDYVLLLYM